MFHYLVPVFLKSSSLDPTKNHLHYHVVTTVSEIIKLTCVPTHFGRKEKSRIRTK